MQYLFRPSALRDLERLPKAIQKRIISKLDFYIKTTNPLKFAEALKDSGVGDYRFRIGDYRVIFDVVNGNILVLSVGHRRDIYKK